MINDWSESIDNGNLVRTIFIDLKEAIDLIDHKLLMKKLTIYYFSEEAVSWFSSYFNMRLQSVCIGHCNSNFQIVECGVPQGSILGPVLFLLYVNDFPLYVSRSINALYADDTTLYDCDTGVQTIQTHLKSDLNAIIDWCHINGMLMNIDKTTSMLIDSKSKLAKNNSVLELSIYGSDVMNVSC